LTTPVRWPTSALAHPVQRLQIELLGSLGRDELHRRPLDRFGDGLRITEAVLLSFRIGARVLRRHQSCVVTLRLQLAAQVMGAEPTMLPTICAPR
jgi:hypothetical protein